MSPANSENRKRENFTTTGPRTCAGEGVACRVAAGGAGDEACRCVVTSHRGGAVCAATRVTSFIRASMGRLYETGT